MNQPQNMTTRLPVAASERRPAHAAWRVLQPSTLSWQMVDRTRSALMAGEIECGDFLGTESSLAGQFGVSRTVVREALRVLGAFGIVEVRAGRNGGVWVASGNTALLVNALAIQLKLIGISQPEMQRAAGKGVTHHNTVARKLSRLSARIKAITTA